VGFWNWREKPEVCRRRRWQRNSSRLPVNSPLIMSIPVMLPPGWPKLPTTPSRTGSAITKKIGIEFVAAFAARAEGLPPGAAMASGFNAINSPTKRGNSSYCPIAQRYSICMFLPSKYPNASSPRRKPARWGLLSSGDRLLRNPINGTPCWLWARMGHTAIPLPSRSRKSRRLMQSPIAHGVHPAYRVWWAAWKCPRMAGSMFDTGH